MKKLLFTLAITFGALATNAQATKLIVNNTSASTIFVTASVANSSCNQIAFTPTSTQVLPGATVLISPLTNTASDNWYAVRVTTNNGPGTVVTTAPSSVSTFNQCLSSTCTLPPDNSNGLSAAWTMPCNDEVTIF